MNNTAAIALAMFALSPSIAAAQPRATPPLPAAERDAAFRRDFEAFLAAGMKRFPTIPSLSVAVVRSDRPVLVTALGTADRNAGRRADAATRFYIASSTKSFVALAFARLAEKGSINLDWTLADLAPEIGFAPGIHPEQVTLRHLLSHSHGLKGDALQFRLAYSGEWDRPALWRLLATLQPNAKAPLGRFAYSNLGYNVAALLIERRLGRDWQEIVEREVTTPLALRDTATRGLARPADRAAPYEGTKPLYLRKTDATMQSAGGMESSARDMARWLSANLAAERGGAGPLAAAMRVTHTPFAPTEGSFGPFVRTGYGLGWYSGPYGSQPLFHSFGGFPGFRAHASFVPELDLGVAAMSNDDGAGYWFVDVAAAYAYDWYRAGPAAAREAAQTRIAALEARMAKAAAPKPEAAMSLSLAPAAYAGRYCNSDWGTIAVDARADALAVRMGALHAPARGDAADAVQVDLIPGQPSRLGFSIANGRVATVKAFGADFARCDGAG